MAIYQPSNITPSLFAGVGGGTVDVNDNAVISWQVNGNSPMTKYEIMIYSGVDTNNILYQTNTITLGQPFYGMDRKGNPVFFTHNFGMAWKDIPPKAGQSAMANGNEYKFKIIQLWDENGNEKIVQQESLSVFKTRAKPTLAIDTTGNITSITQLFTATYSQAQGDTVNWIRWILKNTTDNVIIEDTGNVTTALFEYEYDGFMNGKTYELTCECQTVNGINATATKTYVCSYAQGQASGDVSIRCGSDNSVLLEWMKPTNIPGTATGSYTIDDEHNLNLPQGSSVTWNTVDDEAMAFETPVTLAYRGKNLSFVELFADMQTSTNVFVKGKFAPQRRYFALRKGNNDLNIYQISNDQIVFKTGIIDLAYRDIPFAFSRDGMLLIVGNRCYRFNGNSYSDPIIIDNFPPLTLNWIDCEFSPSRNEFVLNDGNAIYYYSYTYNTTTFERTFTQIAVIQNATTTDSNVTFSPDGNYFVAGSRLYERVYIGSIYILEKFYFGEVIERADYYALTNDRIIRSTNGIFQLYRNELGNFEEVPIYTQNIGTDYIDITNLTLDASKYLVAISHRDPLLYPSSGMAILSFDDTKATMQYEYRIRTEDVLGCAFAPDINQLVMYGTNDNAIKLYSVDYDNVTSFGVEYNSESLYCSKKFNTITISDTVIGTYSATISSKATEFMVLINGGVIRLLSFLSDNTLVDNYVMAVVDENFLDTITSVDLYGKQICVFFFISQNQNYNLADFNYKPIYDADTLFYANFESNTLQAGTLTDGGTVENALYRNNGNSIVPLGRYPTAINKVKDFSAKSNGVYNYDLYFVTSNKFSSAISSEYDVQPKYKSFTLIETVPDDTYDNVFHAVKVWTFGNNFEAMAVSNGNEPNLLQNFTKYPLRQKNSQAPKSGTLTGLLSNVHNGKYADNAEQMERLYDISLSDNTFFLKDMKGNLYMVATSGAITQTPSNLTAEQEVSISIPWTEIGSAENVAVIQTPLDDGWDENITYGESGTTLQKKEVILDLSGNTMTVLPDEGFEGMARVVINNSIAINEDWSELV